MANNYNLIPGAHKLTVEEQSRGGQRSGEVRRERQQLRQVVEEILSGTYEENGEQLTGSQLIARRIIEVINKPYHKDWFKVLQLIVQLTDSDKSEIELAAIEAKHQNTIDEIEKAAEERENPKSLFDFSFD